MEIHDLLSPEGVIANLKAADKKQALQELAAKVSKLAGVNERLVFDTLLERERLGSTGVGHGIAIPHGKLKDVRRMTGLFARAPQPIAFDAIDDVPVDLFLVLLAPESAGADHLKALARVSRLLRDRVMCEKLRATDSADALYALLTETAASQAA